MEDVETKRAVIDARGSTDGPTTDTHLRALRLAAERNGWPIGS